MQPLKWKAVEEAFKKMFLCRTQENDNLMNDLSTQHTESLTIAALHCVQSCRKTNADQMQCSLSRKSLTALKEEFTVCTNCWWRFRDGHCMLESWGKAFAMKGNRRWLHHVTDRFLLPQCGVSFWSRVQVDRLVRRRSCEDESRRCFCHCR